MEKRPTLRRKRRDHLSLYRRHAGSCQATNDLACDCPVWVQGRINGKYIRESLNTRSLGSAEEKIRALLDPEPDGPHGPQGLPKVGGSMSLADARAAFLRAKKNADLASSSLDLYTTACTHFIRYAETQGVTGLRAVTPALIQNYFNENAAAWKSPRTRNSRLTHLRVFFNHAVEMDWLTKTPAKKSLSFRAEGHARAPFTPAEIHAILAAVEEMPEADRATTRALVLLLLYSGMRISDATFCQRRSISEEGVLDYMSIKVRKRIPLPMELHPSAIDALGQVPDGGRDFFFVGEGDYREALQALDRGGHFAARLPAGLYSRAKNRTSSLIKKTLLIAGLDGLCHRFRDTYAVNMLAAGVDIYKVSLALGHSDVRITSRHYLNLVPGYRERMSQASRVLDYTRPQLVSSPGPGAGNSLTGDTADDPRRRVVSLL